MRTHGGETRLEWTGLAGAVVRAAVPGENAMKPAPVKAAVASRGTKPVQTSPVRDRATRNRPCRASELHWRLLPGSP